MKKINHAKFQNRLKLHRETVRSLTEPDLQNVVGGKYPTETMDWPPQTVACLR
jgi:hypothetical protein